MSDLQDPPTFALRGSQRWLQVAVNLNPATINERLHVAAGLPDGATIEWLSPLAQENFREYSDGAVFSRLGVKPLRRPLEDFWPQRGPRWDGLARASSGDVFLVEAKAHLAEMVSGHSRASAPSRAKIVNSLRAVQREIAPGAIYVDWTGAFYQYANRLAHLHFLRVQNGIPAHLVFVYFLHAEDVNGPAERAEYVGARKVIEHCLGVRRSRLGRFIHKLYVDVRDLESLAPS